MPFSSRDKNTMHYTHYKELIWVRAGLYVMLNESSAGR